eukprot:scaffold25540_cov35-Tisochrysis_lutea.AAC.1
MDGPKDAPRRCSAVVNRESHRQQAARGLGEPQLMSVVAVVQLMLATTAWRATGRQHLFIAERFAVGVASHAGAYRVAMLAADAGESQDSLDPYEVLDVPRTASIAEIRRAYRRRAREVHPDVGGSAIEFRRLTDALSALTDPQKRREWDAAEMRRKARARASRSWEDVKDRAANRARHAAPDGDATFRRTGNRREAEEEEAEDSERRRQRWREIAFDGIWREHMPLRARPSQEARRAFISILESAVQAFAQGGERQAQSEELTARLENQERLLLELSNREVLLVEIEDLKQRMQCHRSRVRHLEEALTKAETRAEQWRGTSPVSREDRIQAMERELAFLELSSRLRDRLSEQRLAIERLSGLKVLLEEKCHQGRPTQRSAVARRTSESSSSEWTGASERWAQVETRTLHQWLIMSDWNSFFVGIARICFSGWKCDEF